MKGEGDVFIWEFSRAIARYVRWEHGVLSWVLERTIPVRFLIFLCLTVKDLLICEKLLVLCGSVTLTKGSPM